MFVFSNILQGVAEVLNMLLELYKWAIIINACLSWVSPDPYNPVVRFLYQITEPGLRPIRRILPFKGGVDFSPIIAILVIIFIQSAIITSLFEIAFKLKQSF